MAGGLGAGWEMHGKLKKQQHKARVVAINGTKREDFSTRTIHEVRTEKKERRTLRVRTIVWRVWATNKLVRKGKVLICK